jgi:intracellular septation protein
MRLLYDFFPIVIFFIIYKIYGIYAATASAMIICLLQVIHYRLKYKRFDNMQLITLAIIALFGGATLIFHNPLFIKWKVSVINWLFGIVFLGSQWIGKKNLIQRMLDSKITLTPHVWTSLNLSWAIYFIVIGFANVIAIYTLSTNAWVNFKLFGILGLTVVFVILQAAFLGKHLKHD